MSSGSGVGTAVAVGVGAGVGDGSGHVNELVPFEHRSVNVEWGVH